MSVTVHLVRHGEAVWNAEGRYQGQADSGLTERGHAQARTAADWLIDNLPRVDAVAASDLPRVRDTAAPYLAATGMPATYDPRLREIDVGSWAGRLFADVAQAEPDVVAAAARGEDVRRGGGETFAEARVRVVTALDALTTELIKDRRDDAVLVIFSHGGPIRLATAHAQGIPAPGHHGVGPPGNCSVTSLDWSTPRLLTFNQQTDERSNRSTRSTREQDGARDADGTTRQDRQEMAELQ